MSDQQIIITVSGVDKVGIVAKVSAVLAKFEVNIEKSSYSFKEIKDALTKTGEELGMEIWIQRKEIFDNMHNI